MKRGERFNYRVILKNRPKKYLASAHSAPNVMKVFLTTMLLRRDKGKIVPLLNLLSTMA
jgi:hypothetical protein